MTKDILLYIHRAGSAVGRMDDVLHGVEIVSQTRDTSPGVALQLTQTEIRETHQLQVPDYGICRHLCTDRQQINNGELDQSISQSINQSIKTLIQVDKPQRDKV